MGTGAISTGSLTASIQTYHLIGYMDNEKAFYAIDSFVRELEDEGLSLQTIIELLKEYISICEELVLWLPLNQMIPSFYAMKPVVTAVVVTLSLSTLTTSIVFLAVFDALIPKELKEIQQIQKQIPTQSTLLETIKP